MWHLTENVNIEVANANGIDFQGVKSKIWNFSIKSKYSQILQDKIQILKLQDVKFEYP